MENTNTLLIKNDTWKYVSVKKVRIIENAKK